MVLQKIKQVSIILLTITTVLTLAYIFRTPRNVSTQVVSIEAVDQPNCPQGQCIKRQSNSRSATLPLNPDISTIAPETENNGPEPTSNGLETEQELRRKFVETPYIYNKFTIVTPTYKRTDNIYRILKNYCPLTDLVHKIVVLWNNVGDPVPSKVTAMANNCTIPVVIKIMSKNNLTSRFIVHPEIETTAILSIDDDLLLPRDSLHQAFETWKQYPYLLVGYTDRTYTKRNGRYRYVIHSKTYSMIMTNVAFIHRFYLELFTSTVPKKVIDYIVKHTNGEDITMNVVIGKYLTEMGHPQPVGIKMNTKKQEIGNLSKSGYRGLWHRADHQQQRSMCLNLLAGVYGQLYLKETTKTVTNSESMDY